MGDENAVVNSALYYPFINFRNESWLKRAVLHWDKIARIAPPGYEAIDPPQYWSSQPADLRQLEDLEIVERVDTYRVQAEVETLWSDFLRKHGDVLAKRFRLDLKKRRHVPDDRNPSGYGANPGRKREGVAWMYTPKMSPKLRREFEDLHLLEDGDEHGAPNWSAFDENVLDAYMTTLANALIGTKDIETVADNPNHFRRFQSNSVDELSALLVAKVSGTRARKPKSVDADDGPNMVALAIEAIQPGGIEVMSLDDVLAIRETSRDARREFKKAIDAMVKELRALRAKDLNDRVTEKQLEDLHVRHLKKPLADLRRAMKWNTVDAATSVVTLKSPLESGTLAATLASAAATGSGILTATGLALAALTAWRNARQRKKELKKQPLAWLLDVEKTLDSRGVLAKLR